MSSAIPITIKTLTGKQFEVVSDSSIHGDDQPNSQSLATIRVVFHLTLACAALVPNLTRERTRLLRKGIRPREDRR